MAHRMYSDKNKTKNYDSPTKDEMKKTSAMNKNRATLGPGAEGNKFSDSDWAPSSRYKADNHMGTYKRPKKKAMSYSRGSSY